MLKSMRALKFVVVSILGLTSLNAFGSMYFTLSGASSQMTMSQEYQMQSLGGTIDFDIGDYLRLGYTHKQEKMKAAGLAKNEDTGQIEYSDVITSIAKDSIDLSIIVYPGTTLVPYIFGGIVYQRGYTVKTIEQTSVRNKSEFGIMPQGGFGLGIMLSKSFQLKLAYTLSPGIKMLDYDGKTAKRQNSSMSVGITYKI